MEDAAQKMADGNWKGAMAAMRGVGRISREKEDVGRAMRELEAQQVKLEDLERDLADEIDRIEESIDPAALEVEPVPVRPRKTDIAVRRFGLTWRPYRVTPDGIAEPLDR